MLVRPGPSRRHVYRQHPVSELSPARICRMGQAGLVNYQQYLYERREFQEDFGSRRLVVVGAAMDSEGWEVVRPYVDEWNLQYSVFLATDKLVCSAEIPSEPKTAMP